MVIGSSIKRLSKVARDFNVGISTIVDFLHKKGFDIDTNPNNKITDDAFHLLEKEYKGDISLKKESEKINLKSHRGSHESISLEDVKDTGHKHVDEDYEDDEVIIKGHNTKKVEAVPHVEPKPIRHEHKEELITTNRQEIESPKVIGKIDLDNLGGTKKKEEPLAPPVPVEKPKPVHHKPVVEAQPVQEIPVFVPEVKAHKPPKEEKPEPVIIPEVKEEPVRSESEDDRFSSDHVTTNVPTVEDVKVVGRIDLDLLNQKTRPAKKSKKQKEDERKDRERVRRDVQRPAEGEAVQSGTPPSERPERIGPTVIKARAERLSGPTVVGKIELPSDKRPGGPANDAAAQANRKKKRKRITKDIPGNQQQRVNVADKPVVAGERKKLVVTKNIGGVPRPAGDKPGLKKRTLLKKEVSEEDVQKQIKDTLARLTTKGTKSKGSKYRKDKRQMVSDKMAAQAERDTESLNILKVTEWLFFSKAYLSPAKEND